MLTTHTKLALDCDIIGLKCLELIWQSILLPKGLTKHMNSRPTDYNLIGIKTILLYMLSKLYLYDIRLLFITTHSLIDQLKFHQSHKLITICFVLKNEIIIHVCIVEKTAIIRMKEPGFYV